MQKNNFISHRLPKLLTLLTLLTTLITSGFGCKGTTADQQASVKPVSLEYWTVYDDVDAIRASVAKFQATHPYITVNVRQIGATEIYDRLVEALAEDKGPDIISVPNKNIGQYVSKLAAMPLSVRDTTMVTQQNQLGGTDTVINTVMRSMITPMQVEREYVQAVKGDAVRGGKVYGLPLSLDTMGIYYNKDLLDRAGIPLAPKTWEEFQKAVEKLTKFDKTTNKILQAGTALGTGANVPGSDDILYLLFQQSKAPFVNAAGQAVFNQGGDPGKPAPAVAILNFYTDFANPNRTSYSWNETMPNALDAFVNGSVAFFFGYSYHYPIIKARAPQLTLDILPMLQISPENPVNVASYSLQTVTLKSRHQNEAWNVVDYLTHSSATKDYLDRTNRPTALRFYIGSQQGKAELAPFLSQALVATNWYRGNNYPAAQKAIYDMFREWAAPVPDGTRENDWLAGVLNRAVQKINQTF